MRKAALFDLDGVLVDSEPVYTRIWESIDQAVPTGIPGFALKIKGTTLPHIMQYFNAEDRPKVMQMLEVAEETMEYPLFEDTLAFLEKLKNMGVACAIVTSSNNKKMDKLFGMHPYLKDYFKVVITDSCVTKSKPDPECYLTAAQLLGVSPEDSVVFEDSFNGLAAGRGSGAFVVALTTSNPRQSLYGKADMIIDSFSQLDFSQII